MWSNSFRRTEMGDPVVTLKFWHGGKFIRNSNGLVYEGGLGKTFKVDVDELCWWYLMELVQKCGKYSPVHRIYYLNPGQSLAEGLTKVYNDNEVRLMAEIALKSRVVEVYVEHGVDNPLLWSDDIHRSAEAVCEGHIVGDVNPKDKTGPTSTKAQQKPIHQKAQSQPNVEKRFTRSSPNKVLMGPLCPSKQTTKQSKPTITLQISDNTLNKNLNLDTSHSKGPTDGGTNDEEISEDESVATEDLEKELEELERDDEGEDIGGESSDDEWETAQNNIRVSKAKLAVIAAQLQKEAEEGRLISQRSELRSAREKEDSREELADISEGDGSEEECKTPEDSEDEGVGSNIRKQRKYVSSDKIDYNSFKWEVGLRFPSRSDFRAAISKYAITRGRDLFYAVSAKGRNQRLGVKCKAGCPFTLYASWDNNSASFMVKSVEDHHTCNRTMESNRQLKSSWLAEQLLDLFKARPHWPAPEIIETVKRAYKVNIVRDKAYKVKWLAHQKLHGSMKDHYKKVGRYLAALEKVCPDSTFILQKEPDPRSSLPTFNRCFISFDALRKGWLDGCRKVLAIDGCFLKTFLGGQLLAAIGRDGNDQMFPLVWAVVEGESIESWEWFFTNLQHIVTAGDGDGWTIISDEHHGIINACAKVLPQAEHRHCARHIYAHWHKKNRGEEMKKFFWSAVWSYTEEDMEEVLEEMGKVSPSAVDDFRAKNPQVFCRAFMKVDTKCDVVTSNMAETFNGFIVQARTKHLIDMLEDIRCAFMQRLVVKRISMEKIDRLLCPRPAARLEKEKLLASDCYVMPSSDTVFGVNHKLDKLVVDLEKRQCTCRKWDLTGLPCCHAIACIFFLYKEAESYVHPCYLRQTYIKTYSYSIPPIEGEKHWPKVDLELLPPPIKVGPGRPRKQRRKDPFEDPKRKGKLSRHGQVLSCSVCKSKEHTKRKCPDKNKEVEPPAKRGRGRPRKTDIPQNQPSQADSTVTAQPTLLGRSGRTIRGGRGSRGGRGTVSTSHGGEASTSGGRGTVRGGDNTGAGGRGTGRGSGRGGRRGRPYYARGVGVLITEDGTPVTNTRGQMRVIAGDPNPTQESKT